jgi:hypothetical protein
MKTVLFVVAALVCAFAAPAQAAGLTAQDDAAHTFQAVAELERPSVEHAQAVGDDGTLAKLQRAAQELGDHAAKLDRDEAVCTAQGIERELAGFRFFGALDPRMSIAARLADDFITRHTPPADCVGPAMFARVKLDVFEQGE